MYTYDWKKSAFAKKCIVKYTGAENTQSTFHVFLLYSLSV